MGAFSGDTVKRHLFLSNRYWIHGLVRQKPVMPTPSTTVKRSTNRKGKTAVTGNKVELKQSENYTDDFGFQVSKLWQSFCDKAPLEDDCFDELEPAPVSLCMVYMEDVLAHIAP